MSIVIRGSFQLDPARLEEAREILAAMSEASEAEEGCHCYRFAFDVRDGSRVHLIEHWESDEALAAHFASPHMATFQAAAPGYVVAAPEVLRYEVSSVGPLS